MKRNGAKRGIATRLSPHVQKLMQTAMTIVTSIEKETMKHPPLIGYDACIVIVGGE